MQLCIMLISAMAISFTHAFSAKYQRNVSSKSFLKPTRTSSAKPSMVLSLRGGGIAGGYSNLLVTNPILTKSVTSGLIFGMSDVTSQIIECARKRKTAAAFDTVALDDESQSTLTTSTTIDRPRTLTSMMIGLIYFGPAAHFWYALMFKILPSRSLVSTLGKAGLGQVIFGPVFNILYFAIGLIQANRFSRNNLMRKIINDLPNVMKSGVFFWPLVDLVCFTLIPEHFILLFVNFCSFLWTIYLAGVANANNNNSGTEVPENISGDAANPL